MDAATGAPLKRAMIYLRAPGARRDAGAASTDSAGLYEIKNIAPGTYVAECAKSGFISTSFRRGRDEVTQIVLAEGQDLKDIDFQLPRSGVISGSVTDQYKIPIAGVVVLVQRKAFKQGKMRLELVSNFVTDDRGRYRVPEVPAGHYYVEASRQGSLNDAIPFYARVLFPSASRVEEAQPVDVKTGEEVSGINFELREATVFNVSGKVVDLRTGVAASGARLFYSQDSGSAYSGPFNGNGQAKADGTFRLTGLGAGHYRVGVQVLDTNSRGRTIVTQRFFDVPDRSVTGLTFTLAPGATLRGRVQAAGGNLPEKLAVRLLRSSGELAVDPAYTQPDGAFEFLDVQPDTYTLEIARIGAPGSTVFYTSNVTVAGNEAIDTGIVVAEGASAIEVAATIDFRGGKITGKALDASNSPLDGQNIALIPTDAKRREFGRYFKRSRSTAAGDYTIAGIVPGDYYLLLWPGKDPGVVQDPEVMALVEKHCVRVSIEPSAAVSQDLKLLSDVEKIARSFAWF